VTLHWSTAVLLAVVGAATREVGICLLALADTVDPPVVRPRVEREMYVPEAWSVTW
jgi:hypothetical protein